MKKKIVTMITCCMVALLAVPCITMAQTQTTASKNETTTTQKTQTTTTSRTETTTVVTAPKEIINAKLKVPKFTTVTRKGSGKTKVRWDKVSGVSGYQIQYGTKKDYKGAKTINITKASTVAKTLPKMSKSKDTFIRIRSFKKSAGTKVYSKWSAEAKVIVWKSKWKYAGNSKIHSDPTVLYRSPAAKRKNKVIAVNAGHGCRGGSSKRTLCHPNGTAKVTGGSTAAGSKYATAINSGTSVRGMSEASANLKVALKLKTKLLNAGYDVLMIRQDSDAQLDNIARTVMANNNANCHIAIHFDSTTSNKGAFYISVPSSSSYRNMKPVKYNWRKHNALGSDLVRGLRSAGVKIWGSGSLALDLTQTSYSTIASVDVEVGDQGTSTSGSHLNRIANGLLKGIKRYY